MENEFITTGKTTWNEWANCTYTLRVVFYDIWFLIWMTFKTPRNMETRAPDSGSSNSTAVGKRSPTSILGVFSTTILVTGPWLNPNSGNCLLCVVSLLDSMAAKSTRSMDSFTYAPSTTAVMLAEAADVKGTCWQDAWFMRENDAIIRELFECQPWEKKNCIFWWYLGG